MVVGESSASRSGPGGGLFDADVFESDSSESHEPDAAGGLHGHTEDAPLMRSQSGPGGGKWGEAGSSSKPGDGRATKRWAGPAIAMHDTVDGGRSAAVVAAHVGGSAILVSAGANPAHASQPAMR